MCPSPPPRLWVAGEEEEEEGIVREGWEGGEEAVVVVVDVVAVLAEVVVGLVFVWEESDPGKRGDLGGSVLLRSTLTDEPARTCVGRSEGGASIPPSSFSEEDRVAVVVAVVVMVVVMSFSRRAGRCDEEMEETERAKGGRAVSGPRSTLSTAGERVRGRVSIATKSDEEREACRRSEVPSLLYGFTGGREERDDVVGMVVVVVVVEVVLVWGREETEEIEEMLVA